MSIVKFYIVLSFYLLAWYVNHWTVLSHDYINYSAGSNQDEFDMGKVHDMGFNIMSCTYDKLY